jgi:putative transposase
MNQSGLSAELPVLTERTVADTLDINRVTLRRYCHLYRFSGPPRPRLPRSNTAQNALTQDEQEQVITVLCNDEFCDQPPAQIYYSLLSRGEYLCSVSTMHRLLRQQQLKGERRRQRPTQYHATPRLHARQPNQVWTWDITKLATEVRGVYLSLYVVMDLFSRFIVSWMLSRKENSALSSQLIQQASARYEIAIDQLTLHQDRGSPMTAHCYLDLLGELAITASHSRPRVSNDNPMSEAQFKTMKYQPDYPRRFRDYHHAQLWCRDYVQWYNHDHHHSALAGFTPEQVFTGDYLEVARQRQMALDEAYRQHPRRFINGKPEVSMPPGDVYINPVTEDCSDATESSTVNFPTLRRVRQLK